MMKIVTTQQFALDVQIMKTLGYDLTKLKPIIESLAGQKPLPLYCCDNPIPGTWGRWNCKVGYGWWVIYKCDAKAGTITLERTGTTAELFG